MSKERIKDLIEIERFLEILKKVWVASPNLSFGCLVTNVLDYIDSKTNPESNPDVEQVDIETISDDDFLQELIKWSKEYTNI